MKKLTQQFLIILFLVPAMVFTSCNDDEEGEVGGKADLVGTWSFADVGVEFTIDGEDFIEWAKEAFDLTESEAQELEELFSEDFTDGFDGNVTFNDDNTYSATSDGETENGTYSLNGDKLTIVPDDEESIIFDVVKLNSSTLVISSTETETDDLDEDGTSETLEVTLSLTLEK